MKIKTIILLINTTIAISIAGCNAGTNNTSSNTHTSNYGITGLQNGTTAEILPRPSLAWMGGKAASQQVSNFGTKGVIASSNIIGAREGAQTWKDASGKLWVLGGYGYTDSLSVGPNQYLSDLWSYDPVTQKWTWQAGSKLSAQIYSWGTKGGVNKNNFPSARKYGVTGNDLNGNVYVFGGYGYDCDHKLAELNDLWSYNTNTKQWTWISGSNGGKSVGKYGTRGIASVANTPGARSSASSFTDKQGNLWVFGGYGWDANNKQAMLNDMWKFDVKTKQWTWISGSKDKNTATAIYGTKGLASSQNTPGARRDATQWVDKDGNFWLFGGNAAAGELNDLWKFNPTTKQWTWVSGDTTVGVEGNYGTENRSSPINRPGSRFGATAWADSNGNLWMFGGYGKDSATNSLSGELSDLWKFDVTTKQWTWITGWSSSGQRGSYGTLGISSPNNFPTSRRIGKMSWVDNNGRFWMFGGQSAISSGQINDLWLIDARDVIARDKVIEDGAYPVLGSNATNQVYSCSESTPLCLKNMQSSMIYWKDSLENIPPTNQYGLKGFMVKNQTSSTISGLNVKNIFPSNEFSIDINRSSCFNNKTSSPIPIPAGAECSIVLRYFPLFINENGIYKMQVAGKNNINQNIDSNESNVKYSSRNAVKDVDGCLASEPICLRNMPSYLVYWNDTLENIPPTNQYGLRGYIVKNQTISTVTGVKFDTAYPSNEFSIDYFRSSCFNYRTKNPIILGPSEECSVVLKYAPMSPNQIGVYQFAVTAKNVQNMTLSSSKTSLKFSSRKAIKVIPTPTPESCACSK